MTTNYAGSSAPLHYVSFSLTFPEDPARRAPVTANATGHSMMRRPVLWTESNVWDQSEDVLMTPADWLHHVALCCLQDRPNTSERLLFSLTGGLGEQTSMF